LLRRISGGGTVYHDHGNLNYSFVLGRESWEPERWIGLVAQALRDLGLPGVRACSRYSIWLDSRKVSGSAFALSGPSVMLHGCILLQTNLERLQQLLTPEIKDEQEKNSRAIASVRSPVVNLHEFRPGLSADELIEAICRQVNLMTGKKMPAKTPEMLQIPEEKLLPYRKKFADPEWTLELAKGTHGHTDTRTHGLDTDEHGQTRTDGETRTHGHTDEHGQTRTDVEHGQARNGRFHTPGRQDW